MSPFSFALLRYSWVALFLWFGFQQLLFPQAWISYLPEWTGYMTIPGEMLVRLNGWLELILAAFLLFGIYTRVVAALLALHLFTIAIAAGGAIGMRDAVLGMIGVVIAMNKPDEWTLDAKNKMR